MLLHYRNVRQVMAACAAPHPRGASPDRRQSGWHTASLLLSGASAWARTLVACRSLQTCDVWLGRGVSSLCLPLRQKRRREQQVRATKGERRYPTCACLALGRRRRDSDEQPILDAAPRARRRVSVDSAPG